MSKFLCLAVFSLFLTYESNANAIVISLIPTQQEVLVGEKVSIDILYDTDLDSTEGGVFSINFDNNSFDFVSISFNENLPDNPFLRVKPTTQMKEGRINLGFGNGLGISGAGKVATISFLAQKKGMFNFILDSPSKGHKTFLERVSFIDTSIQVNDVGIPAAFWMLLIGLTSLSLVARRKTISIS